MFEVPNRILAVLCGLAVCASAAVDQCKPIGWATRSGRTSTAFEVTGGGGAYEFDRFLPPEDTSCGKFVNYAALRLKCSDGYCK